LNKQNTRDYDYVPEGLLPTANTLDFSPTTIAQRPWPAVSATTEARQGGLAH
jgi:hypothetical protein